MLLPDGFLLRKIINQHLYLDKLSHEASTNVTKRKYKLAGNIISDLKIYSFFDITSNQLACNQMLTVTVELSDWENLVSYHTLKSIGYIDISKFEILSSNDIVSKMRDCNNGFECHASLCDTKYFQLRSLRTKIGMVTKFISAKKQMLIRIALDEVVDTSKMADDLIQELGI